LTGAALGSAISLILWNAAMAALIWRLLHLVPSALAVFSHSARRARGNDR
jgi:hypothetical protein